MGSLLSEKQIMANRENALRSTGPKTPEGKKASSLNAQKYGFLSKQVVIPSIDGADAEKKFQYLYDSLVEDFMPRNAMESLEVYNLTCCYWKKYRIQQYEQAYLEKNARYFTIDSLVSKVKNQTLKMVDDFEDAAERQSFIDEIVEKEVESLPKLSSIPNEELQDKIRKYENRINREIERSLRMIKDARNLIENS